MRSPIGMRSTIGCSMPPKNSGRARTVIGGGSASPLKTSSASIGSERTGCSRKILERLVQMYHEAGNVTATASSAFVQTCVWLNSASASASATGSNVSPGDGAGDGRP